MKFNTTFLVNTLAGTVSKMGISLGFSVTVHPEFSADRGLVN